MRRFARVDLGDEVVPDESTILRFRHLLEQHALTRAIFEEIESLLEERRLLLRSGTIVDATIIAAPSSTMNASATRDPERGIVHTLVTAPKRPTTQCATAFPPRSAHYNVKQLLRNDAHTRRFRSILWNVR
jgi:IS5 family transposase